MKYLLFLGLFAAAQAAYPTTYPFENEDFVPELLPASTPNSLYDETDPGGYVYVYMYMRDLADAEATEFPFCWSDGGALQYCFVHHFGAPPRLPPDQFNCTGKNIFIEPSMFSGVVVGRSSQQVCNINECCSDWYGSVVFSVDQFDWADRLDKLASGGMCNEISEHVYCLMVAGHFHINCYEMIPTPTDREYVFMCHDEMILFWKDCSVYKATGMDDMFTSEPPAYLEQLSVAETFTHTWVFWLPDHICHPHSYYAPAGASTTASETTTTESSGSSVVSAALFAIFVFLF